MVPRSPGTTSPPRCSRTRLAARPWTACSRSSGPACCSPPGPAGFGAPARPRRPGTGHAPGPARGQRRCSAAGSCRRSAPCTSRWPRSAGPRRGRLPCCRLPARPRSPAGSARRRCSSRARTTRCSGSTRRPRPIARSGPAAPRRTWSGSTAVTTAATRRAPGSTGSHLLVRPVAQGTAAADQPARRLPRSGPASPPRPASPAGPASRIRGQPGPRFPAISASILPAVTCRCRSRPRRPSPGWAEPGTGWSG